jgi:hypothetical protein
MLQKDFINALKFASAAMEANGTRYNLVGVYLEFNADQTITLTGTDGHRLHTVTMEHDHEHAGEAYIIAADSVKRWLTSCKPVRGTEMRADISAPCGIPMLHSIPGDVIDGHYPDYRPAYKKLDEPAPTTVIGLHADYLANAARAIKGLDGGGGHNGLRVELFGEKQGIKITPPRDGFWTEALCIIMPMKL